MLVDTLGRPLRFIVTPGQTGDITQAPALLEDQAGSAVQRAWPPFAGLAAHDQCVNCWHLVAS